MLYIDKTGRLDDRFRKHLIDVKNNYKDASKPVSKHIYLLGHSFNNMTVCGLPLIKAIMKAAKIKLPMGSTNAYHSTNLLRHPPLLLLHQQHSFIPRQYINTHTHT